jgi:D-serine deaminase-like pyridoxal phosphate-dependent protein
MIQNHSNLELKGLHVYDGNLRERDLIKREQICNEAFEPVVHFVEKLHQAGIQIKTIVAGGSPGFSIHAKRKSIETSPGTTVLWDYGYGTAFPDLDFKIAALVFTRVISKPGNDLLCFDLGHKAIGDDMPNPRVYLMGFSAFEVMKHNEEHLVIKTPEANKWKIGDSCFGIPYHICPTVVRYNSAFVIKDNKLIDEWKITARDRKLTI